MTHAIDMAAADQALNGANPADVFAADLRVLTLDFRKGTPTQHIVLASQLDAIIEASKRLHFEPGVNPANGNQNSRIWRLRVAELNAYGPYWWSTPDLGRNGDPDGALIFQAGVSKTVWIDESYDPEGGELD